MLNLYLLYTVHVLEIVDRAIYILKHTMCNYCMYPNFIQPTVQVYKGVDLKASIVVTFKYNNFIYWVYKHSCKVL